MEYLEKNYTPMIALGIGYVSKKVFKKELLPVSTWSQMFTTYLTLLSAQILRGLIEKEERRRNTIPPKPN